MKADNTVSDVDTAGIPGDFRENYRFLHELINCRQKNNSLTAGLENLPVMRLSSLRGRLNRRQLKVLTDYLTFCGSPEEPFEPPVPEELEASIRIRKRSTWLPWEAEAVRKIDLWRKDVLSINRSLEGNETAPHAAVARIETGL
jgi:hypothetical protein